MLTRSELETALDARRLYMRMHTGNWWVLRRNGKTQTWKTRNGAFRIPFKAGLRATAALTQEDLCNDIFRIAHDMTVSETITAQVLVPHDMEYSLTQHDAGPYECLLYKGREILIGANGKVHQGIYIGPFIISDDKGGLTDVGTLDAARKRIDDEEVGVAAVLQGEDGSLTIHTGKRR